MAVSVHAREIGLRDADDSALRDYARLNNFASVSKDSDFQQRRLLYGSPTKFLCRSPFAPAPQSNNGMHQTAKQRGSHPQELSPIRLYARARLIRASGSSFQAAH
jgi:hypothetical protein